MVLLNDKEVDALRTLLDHVLDGDVTGLAAVLNFILSTKDTREEDTSCGTQQ